MTDAAPAPRRRLGRALRLAGLLLLGTLATLVAAALWLLNSEDALRWGIAQAQRVLPGLSVQAVEGRLAGPLRLHGLRLERDGTRVRIGRLHLDWQPTELLSGVVVVRTLHAEEVQVHLPPASDTAPDPQRAGPLQVAPLPVAVRVLDASVQDLALHPADGEAVRFERIGLAGSWWGTRLRLASLDVAAPWGEAHVDGRLGLRGGAHVALDTRWRLNAGLARPLSGSGAITGTFARPHIEQRLQGALDGQLSATLAWQEQPLQWHAGLALDHLSPAHIDPAWPATRVAGAITAEGTPERFRAGAELSADDPQFGRWNAVATLEREPELWRLAHLRLAGPQAIGITGSAVYGGESADVSLAWHDLRWPLQGAATVTSPAGKLRAAGWLDGYHARAEATVAAADLPPARLQLSGNGDSVHLNLPELAMEWLGGRWQGNAAASWKEAVTWGARIQAAGIDPAQLLPEWDGKIGMRLRSSGTLKEGRPELSVALERLDGTLRGRPVAGSARALIAGDTYRIEELQLRSGPATVRASGRLAEQWDLTWSIDTRDVGALVPGTGGTLKASGNVTGPRNTPRIVARADGGRLAWQQWRIAGLDLDADIDLSGREPWRAVLETRDVGSVEGPRLDRIALRADGGAERHRLDLALNYQSNRLTLAADGAYGADGWRGTLRDGRLRTTDYGNWRQQAPSDLTVAVAVALQRWCWQRSDDAAVCTVVERPADGVLKAELDASGVPLAPLGSLLGDAGLTLAGRAAARVRIEFGEQLQRLQGHIEADGTRLRYVVPERPVEAVFETARLRVDGDPDGMRANLRLAVARGGRADVDLALPGWVPPGAPADSQPLDGALRLNLDGLRWLALFTTDISEPRGRLDADLRLGGSIGEPEVAGHITVSEGQLAIPAAGVTLEAIRLRVATVAGAARELALDGSAKAGAGDLSLSGSFRAPQLRDWQLRLNLTGSQVETVRLPAAHVFTTPDLALRVVPGGVRLGGSLAVPRADIELPEIPTGAVTPSPDVVIVDSATVPDADAPPPTPGWKTLLEVKVTLGDAVNLSGYGFSGRLTGQLTLVQRPEGLLTAVGELNIVDGQYKAYGQDLTITSGRLLYSGGPLDNPGLDLRAERQVDAVTAGMHVSGRLQDPRVELYSSPAMEESDALSYLVLGRPLSGASAGEGSLLAQAALSLGIKGGDRLAKSIGNELGIDEVALESGDTIDQTALVLGKQLSSRLYLRYIVGLGEAVNTLQIRYKLSRHLMLEAESGVQSGGDILYTIER